MAKRKSKKNQGSPLQRILYTLLIAILAIIVYAFGLEDMLLEEEGDDGGGGGNPAVEVDEPITVSGDWYSVYFTQTINSDEESNHHGAAIEQALIAEIDNAQNTIDAALFELNAPDVTDALKRALERGVTMRIVADDDHNLDDPESTIEELIDLGAEVVSDDRSALMHDKFFIIDRETLWTGSMNITRNGIYNNNNNGLVLRGLQIARNYQNEFEEMFIERDFTTRQDIYPIATRSLTINDTILETYFSPEDGDLVVERIVELIGEAQSSVRVMSFSFTLDDIGNAMIERLDDGITVEGVIETTGSLQGQLPPLACAGANMRQDGNPDIMHHKVFIIDEAIVVTGSLNFSASARDNNSENVLIIHNPDIAAAYTTEWQARFNDGRVPPAEDLDC